MANRDQFKAQDFIEHIPGSGGIIATIAKRVGCDWHTAKKYVTDYPTVKLVYDDECNAIDDLAVSTVLKAIKDGDVSTAKWWLAKKRKAEFGEALELNVNFDQLTDEQLARIIKGEDVLSVLTAPRGG